MERTVLRHQATTWELLHVLFSAIDGEQPPAAALQAAAQRQDGSGGTGPKGGTDGTGGGEDADMAGAGAAGGEAGRGQDGMQADGGGGEDDDLRLDRLAAFKRRAQLRCEAGWACACTCACA